MQIPATWCMYCLSRTPPPDELLDINIIGEEYRQRPNFAYPMERGNIRLFGSIHEWYDYVKSLRLQPKQVFLPYVDGFDEGLRALFMTYVLPEFCKMGEMRALATLEGALLAAYEHKMCKTKAGEHHCATLAPILRWANKNDGLPAEWFKRDPSNRSPNDLDVIRNKQMHGEVLQETTLPWAGLFEVIKETIEYAYRNHPPYDIHEMRLTSKHGQRNMTRG